MTLSENGGRGWRRWGGAVALAISGLVAGGVLAATVSANADTATGGTTGGTTSSAAPQRTVDESKSQRPDETLLTGDAASKVRAAALAKYPGATVLRVETDSDGVYEAHLQTAAGQRVTVEVGKDFAVTGTEAAPAGPGGPGGHDGWPPAGGNASPPA